MRLGIIGSGRIGSVVGRLLADAGHEIMFSSRHPEARGCCDAVTILLIVSRPSLDHVAYSRLTAVAAPGPT